MPTYNGSYRVGAGLCNPDSPSMESSLTRDPVYEQEEQWLGDFFKDFCVDREPQPPRPCLVRGIFRQGKYILSQYTLTPCWTGGLQPFGDAYQDDKMLWVCSFSGGYFWIPAKQKVAITNQHYEDYFVPKLKRKNLYIHTRFNNQIDSDIITIQKRGIGND